MACMHGLFCLSRRLMVCFLLMSEVYTHYWAFPYSIEHWQASCQSANRSSRDVYAVLCALCDSLALLWQDIVKSVEANLSDPSQAMRVATLRLLCCFEQPPLMESAATAPTSAPQTSQAFWTCLSIQTQPFTADSGRQAAVAIGKLRNQLEYKQVPSAQIAPVVRCLIGIMHIR